MSAMELNMATGLRAELETIRNRSLLGGAILAFNSFYNLQKNQSLITGGLSLFEDVYPIESDIPKDDTKAKSKGDNIPITEIENPPNSVGDRNKKGRKKRKKKKKE